MIASCFQRLILCSATWACLSACVQTLPTIDSLDKFQKVAERSAAGEIAELESRRATGKISAADYKSEKEALDDRITQRAHQLAWSHHDLEESQREALGMPSPDHYTTIAVPEAGSLPTGSQFNRFNSNQMGSTTNESVAGIRDMVRNSGYTPGSNVRSKNLSPGGSY
jgi:hypothetical protein